MQTVNFDDNYYELLTTLFDHGVEEVNARTGVRIKMLLGAYSFKLDLSDGLLPTADNRKYFPHVAAAETAWQLMGTKDPAYILKHAPKLWSKFVEDGVLKTAYGYRWREAFGRDQLALAIDELKNNPSNRQLYISAWDPAHDGLGGPQPKNIPCPVGFTVSRYKDAIHMSVLIRSSDVFVGLPYDVMSYCLTLAAIAASVECKPGTISFTLAHAHLYEPHWAMTEECFDNWRESPLEQTPLPTWSVEEILQSPDEYVRDVKLDAVAGNKWNPLPDVIE